MQKMIRTQKILNISLLQAFGILCVLLGHSVHIFSSWGWYFHNAPQNTTCNIIHHVIYSFHMPLFIFLSGYLFYKIKSDNFNIIKYIFKRIKRLIVPFFAVGFLYYIPMFRLISPENRSLVRLIKDFVTLDFCGPFWFLISLFFISLVVISFTETKLNKIPVPIIDIGLIVLNLLKISGIPFAVQCVPKLAIYFYLGYLIVKYEKPIYSYFINNKTTMIIVTIGWGVLEIFKYKNFDNTYLTLITASVSIFVLFAFSVHITKKFKNISTSCFVQTLSINMLFIYLIQEPIMFSILKALNWGIGYNAIFVAYILFISTLIICLGFIYLKSQLFRKDLV